ncbi:hypothetical protein AOQ84DRAFT_8121 [Glonium stellatum]|uniref:Uncharacterized protein n=1 Tax=Glonium stellatum TaxID=574774 RepID=A0A8E2JUS7_9PEZI|nr:hypothetical protein AOQ84DRAFT_8121 [Glonium stellatum]
MVYEYLLVNNHCRNDPVFSIPAIKKMIQKREAIKRRRQAMLEKRLARRMKPVQHRVTATIPLVYTSIYSTCKQIHDEAKDVFFRMNSFHIVIPDFDFIYRRDDMLFLKGLDDSWDFPRITNLQLELCISSIFNLKTRVNWVDLTKNLPYLRKLQVFVTSSNFSRFKTTELYDWERVNWKYKAAFRDLVAAIPKSVDVKWGLTLKQKLGNFKGKDYLEGKVLRAMYRQYENQRGIDYEVPDTMAVDEDDTESVVDPYAGYSSMFDDD